MKIVVAVPTRQRPDMLASCLRSLAQLQVPVGYQLQVVVVENNLTADCELLVSDLAKAHAHIENVVYQLEPKLGISFARNTCAQLAIDLGADYLAFIDDDETVTPEWLVHHMAAMENLNAHLLGGPVRLADAAYTLNWLNRIMFKALKHRYQEVELKALAVSSAPHPNNPTVHTNNWICKTSVFKTHGLFFNEELRQMGGEDTEFFRDCVNKGLKTGWVANAVVWDHLPQSRLSVRYQYERSRDQSNAHLHYKLNTKTTSVLEACAAILVRLIYFPFLWVLVVFAPGKFSLKFIRNVGWIKGRVDALLGKRHAHYKMTTGT